jgi:RIO-like serine/threonine protein kinase
MIDRISREPLILRALQQAYDRGEWVSVHDLVAPRCALQTVRRHIRRLRKLGVLTVRETPRLSPVDGKKIPGRGLLTYQLSDMIGNQYLTQRLAHTDGGGPGGETAQLRSQEA